MVGRALVVAVMAIGLVSAQQAADPAILREVRAIRAIDNHAYVVRPVPGDHDYDALPFELLDPPPAGINDREITRARASQLARMVMRDNAKKLYGL
jgi:hypothetical protein